MNIIDEIGMSSCYNKTLCPSYESMASTAEQTAYNLHSNTQCNTSFTKRHLQDSNVTWQSNSAASSKV